MSEAPKETRAAKPVETRTAKPEEKKDTSPVDMTPLEYSKRFNPIAAHLTNNATKEKE